MHCVLTDVVGRNDERNHALAKEAITEDVTQRSLEWIWAVFRPPHRPHGPPSEPIRENGCLPGHIELEDLAWGQPGAETKGDDATCRRTNDKVEMRSHRAAKIVLEGCQECRHEYPADAPAVQRENLEALLIVHCALAASGPCSSRRPP